MKQLSQLLSIAILISVAILFSNCGGDDDPAKSAEETQLEKLKGTWTLQNGEATFDDTETREFPGMTLTISGTFAEGGTYSYAVDVSSPVNASPWPSTGKWEFGSPVTSSLVRLDSEPPLLDSDVPMTYSLSNGDKTLTIEFDYEGPGYELARTGSVDGGWTFVFTRP